MDTMFQSLQTLRMVDVPVNERRDSYVIASSKLYPQRLPPIIIPSDYLRPRSSISPTRNTVGYGIFDYQSSPVSFCSTPTSTGSFSSHASFSFLQNELPESLIRPIWTLCHEGELKPKIFIPTTMVWSFVNGYMFSSQNGTEVKKNLSGKDVVRQADFLVFTFKFFRTNISKKICELLNNENVKPIVLRGIKNILAKEPNFIEVFGIIKSPVAIDISDFSSEELIDITPKLTRYDNIYTVDTIRSVTPKLIS